MAINRNDWIDEVKQDMYGPTGNPAELSTATGSAPSYSARAWVNFNGTGTVAIRSSGNVSSITDAGVGIYTVNFLTSIQDVNYTTNISSSADAGGGEPRISQTIRTQDTESTQVRIIRNDATSIDASLISVVVTR